MQLQNWLSILAVFSFLLTSVLYFVSFSVGEGSDDYLQNILNSITAFRFNTSLFDIWLISFVKMGVILIQRMASFFVVAITFGACSIYYIVKSALFQFESENKVELGLMIMAFVLVFSEAIWWFMLSKRKQKENYDYLTSNSVKPSIQRAKYGSINRPRGDSRTDESILSHVNEEDFLSAREIDDQESEDDMPKVESKLQLSKSNIDLTLEERELIDLLKIKYPQYEEEKLHRFLLARGDYVRADESLAKEVAWRRDNKIDELQFDRSPIPMRGFFVQPDTNGEGSEIIKKLSYYNSVSVHKFAKNGQPVAIYRAGLADSVGTAQNVPIEAVEQMTIFVAEFVLRNMVQELNQRSGYNVRKMTMIIDLLGLGLRQLYPPALRYFIHLIRTAEQYYPETIILIYVINVPPIFQAFWKIIKPAIPPRVLGRIHFLGANFAETLLQYYPAENLPVFLGGLCSCRYEGGCCPYTRSPGYTDPNIDSKGYTIRKIESEGEFQLPMAIRHDELLNHKSVNDGKSMSCKMLFQSEGRNIEYGLYFNDGFDVNYNIDNCQVLVSIQEKNSTQDIIEEIISMDRKGTYVFRFINPHEKQVALHYLLTE